jgi:hypothetical protein
MTNIVNVGPQAAPSVETAIPYKKTAGDHPAAVSR